MTSKVVNRRIRLLFVLLALALAGSLARAVWLQGVMAQPLSSLAAKQQRQTLELPARRGTIFDRNGVPLALGEQATTVYADPTQIRNARLVALAAEKALGLDAETIFPQLKDTSSAFVYLKRKADSAKAELLRKRKLPGVGFYTEERRRYPQGAVGAQVLGFAGQDNQGLAGIELQLDDVLRGRPGRETVIRDPFGRVVDVLSETAERQGRDVFLTLDHRIQAKAEDVLRKTVRQWGAKARDGRRPRSALGRDLCDGHGADLRREPLRGSEPGCAAQPHSERHLRAGVDVQADPGCRRALRRARHAVHSVHAPDVDPGRRPRDPRARSAADGAHDGRRHRRAVVERRRDHACQKLGSKRLSSWVDRFGFGSKTGLDFPGETAGIVPPLARWSGSTIGTLPIGHGIAVTPVQMAAAYAAVANDGVWLQPHLVERVGGRASAHVDRRRILRHDVATQLATMLTGVVAEGGTGLAAAVPGYHVAGKTGTAAKPLPDGSGYSNSRYVASFVGFVPATRPRLVILVTVDEPSTIWGGVVAAPAFQELAQFALQYLEVPPDNPEH